MTEPVDILILSAIELSRLAADELKAALAKLTPEQRKNLTSEQVAAIVEVLDPAFRLTEEETQRRDAARRLIDPDNWRVFVASCLSLIRESYDNREIDLEDAVEAVGRIAIGCWPQARATLLGTMAALLLQRISKPRGAGDRKPAYATWIRRGTADLVIVLKEREPTARLTPGRQNRDSYDPSSPIIRDALVILNQLKWFGNQPIPMPGTIDDWVRERRKEQKDSDDVGSA